MKSLNKIWHTCNLLQQQTQFIKCATWLLMIIHGQQPLVCDLIVIVNIYVRMSDNIQVRFGCRACVSATMSSEFDSSRNSVAEFYCRSICPTKAELVLILYQYPRWYMNKAKVTVYMYLHCYTTVYIQCLGCIMS
jgi:hypothetical protein